MRNALYLAAAAALLMTAPAAAGDLRNVQSTDISSQGIYLEGPGVGVRVGPASVTVGRSVAAGATARSVVIVVIAAGP